VSEYGERGASEDCLLFIPLLPCSVPPQVAYIPLDPFQLVRGDPARGSSPWTIFPNRSCLVLVLACLSRLRIFFSQPVPAPPDHLGQPPLIHMGGFFFLFFLQTAPPFSLHNSGPAGVPPFPWGKFAGQQSLPSGAHLGKYSIPLRLVVLLMTKITPPSPSFPAKWVFFRNKTVRSEPRYLSPQFDSPTGFLYLFSPSA